MKKGFLLLGLVLLGLGFWAQSWEIENKPALTVEQRSLEDQTPQNVQVFELEQLSGLDQHEGQRRESVGADRQRQVPANRISLRGRVVLAEQPKEGVPGARVQMTLEADPRELVTVSDREGYFELALDDVPMVPELAEYVPEIRLRASAKGFLPRSEAIELPRVLDQSSVGPIQIKLTPGASLLGRVLGPLGTLVENANVIIVGSNTKGDVSINVVSCNKAGEFVVGIGDLKLESLLAGAEGFRSQAIDLTGWDIQRNPSVGDVFLKTGAFLAGTLLCTHGEPLGGVELRANPVKKQATRVAQAYSAQTDNMGNFQFDGLVEGGYLIQWESDRFGPFQVGERGIELTSTKRMILLQVLDEQGERLPGIEVVARIGLLDQGAFVHKFTEYADSGYPDGDCLILVEELTWTRALISANASGGQWAESSIDMPESVCFQKIELVLPENVPMGWLQLDLEGASEVQMAAADWNLEALGREQSYFGFLGPGPHEIPVGAYWVEIDFKGKNNSYATPIGPLMVNVFEQEHTIVHQRLELGGFIRLQLTSGGGEELPLGIRARFQTVGSEWESVGFRNQSGRTFCRYFRADGCTILDYTFPTGAASLEISAEGYAPAFGSVNVSSGETLTMEMTLFK